MKGKKKNSDKKVYSKKNSQNKSTLNKCSIKNVERCGKVAMKYYNTLNTEGHEELKADSNNIKRSSINQCKTVFVVVETLSPEILEKYVSINKNLQTKSKKLQKPEQSSISEKLPSEKIQLNDNVRYIFDTKNEVDKSAQPSMVLNKTSVIKAQKKLGSILSSGNILDNNKNLNLHNQYANITRTKVILTKLESMDDNIYIVNWKKKCAEQDLLSKNLEPVILHKDVSINTLPTDIIDSSHKNDTEGSDSHMKKTNGLNLSTLQSKYEQHKIPKVLLVKLEKLGFSFKEQNSISTIKHSTTQCVDRFNNSSNYSNSSTIQLEENSSSISERSSICSESTEYLENLEIYKSSICEIEERPALSKIPQEESFSIAKSIFTTIVQKCIERVSEKSSTEEVVSDDISKSNSKLKKIQTLPLVIRKQDNSSKRNNEQIVSDNIHKKLSYKENHHSDVINKTDSIIKLAENVQTKQKQINTSQLNIAIYDYPIYYECFFCNSYFEDYLIFQLHVKKCSLRSQQMNNADNTNVISNSFNDNENVLETSKRNDTSESSSQQKSFALDNDSTESSTYSNISSLSTISKGKTKKRCHENNDKDDILQCKIFKNDNNNSLRCKVCSKLFDSMISLSNHIYSHTEKYKLRKTYTRKKKNQNSKYINIGSSDDEIASIVTTDSNEQTQECTEESSNTLPVNSTIVESFQSSLEDKEDESTIDKISSMEETRLQKNMSAENVSKTLTTELNIDELITIYEKISFKFCACHEKEFKEETSMGLVLFCNICNVLYQNIDCFKAHLENTELYLCKGKKLTKKISKLYCNICKKILCETKEMRKHMEIHLIHFKSIKLFCHICKIRFIGMGPIFLKHWSHHDVDVFYKASVSHLPALSIVDPTRKEWSLITSDEFKYLIVTEHVCNNCNVQCFSTNQLKDHMSSCKNKPATNLPSIRLSQNCGDSDVQSELDVSVDIDKITFPNELSSEEHTASNKNNSKLKNIIKTFVCKVCSNTFKSFKKLMIHWKNHESPLNFSCNQCTRNFNNFIIYIEHFNYCVKTVNPINDPLSEDTHRKEEFICKVCNIVFDSRNALFQHNAIYKKKLPNLNTVNSNNSSFQISHCSTNQITQNKRVTPINKRISEMPKSQNSIVNQLINSPTTSSSAKIGEIVSDDVCLNNQSIIDQDLENLSSISYVSVTDNLNITQTNNFIGNNRTSVVKNKTEKDANACKVNNDSNKNDSRKDINDEIQLLNTVKLANSKQKTVLDRNTPPFKTTNINENKDDLLIKFEIPRQNEESVHENSWEAIEPTTNLQLNNYTRISEESVKPKKYLRVRNITELIDQPSRYNMFNDQDERTSTSMSSPMDINLLEEEQTKRINVEPHQITKSSNFQQQSVLTSSDSTSHKIIITGTEKQGFICSFSEQKNQKQCLSLLSATAPRLPSTSALVSTSRSLSSSILTSESVQQSATIVSPQLTEIGKSILPEITIIKKSQIAKSPIETSQSAQTSLLIQIPSYIASCTTQPQVSNIQYPSIKPDRNKYLVDHTYAEMNDNCRTYKEQQLQNMTNNKILFDLVSSSPKYSVTNNYSNNTFIIQKNNNELCKTAFTSTVFTSTVSTSTASTSTISTSIATTSTTFISRASTLTTSNSQSTNYVFNNNFMTGQPHNIHNLNEVHNNLSNTVAKANSADIKAQNRTELNLTKMQTKDYTENNNLPNIMGDTQNQSNNLSQMTTFYRSNSAISQFEILL